MNSTYAPKGKSGLTFRFTSQEGHFGTMQATGAMMTSSIEELRDFWVTQRQDIPCFLAAVTLELYDLTTVRLELSFLGVVGGRMGREGSAGSGREKDEGVELTRLYSFL